MTVFMNYTIRRKKEKKYNNTNEKKINKFITNEAKSS